MEDLLYYTCLFDYYKDLFTKQRKTTLLIII